MKILTNRKSNTYMFTVGALLVASTAVAATLTTLHAPDKFTPATPTDSFMLKDGTATVEVSQLEWSRCLVGQTFKDNKCTGEATPFDSWEKALAAPTKQQAADGWRVPNVKELMRITENTQAFPAINTEVFPFASSLIFDTAKNQYGGGTHITNKNSPYIWTATPAKVKTVTVAEDGYTKLTPEQSVIATEKARKNTEMTYALDLGLGIPKEVYRSGESIGERYTSQYGNNDVDNAEKARYVLLVRDIS